MFNNGLYFQLLYANKVCIYLFIEGNKYNTIQYDKINNSNNDNNNKENNDINDNNNINNNNYHNNKTCCAGRDGWKINQAQY